MAGQAANANEDAADVWRFSETENIHCTLLKCLEIQ
jgi:hypothetical protein